MRHYGIGRVGEFPEGETRLATFANPFVTPSDGKTADAACWVRRIEGEQFQVFAVNCAHLAARPLVSAIRSVHVPVPRRRVLPRRLTPRVRPSEGSSSIRSRSSDGVLTIHAGELPTPGRLRRGFARLRRKPEHDTRKGNSRHALDLHDR